MIGLGGPRRQRGGETSEKDAVVQRGGVDPDDDTDEDATEQDLGAVRGGLGAAHRGRHVLDDESDEEEEDLVETRESGTKTTGEDEEDGADNDTSSPNYRGGDSNSGLGGDVNRLRRELFHLPDDDIEDDDEGNEDHGEGQGRKKHSNNKKKRKKNGTTSVATGKPQ